MPSSISQLETYLKFNLNILKAFLRKIYGVSHKMEPMLYRSELFSELTSLVGNDYFESGRFLEIGPKDGLDSYRLAALKPEELVLVDLPEKRYSVERWLHKIVCPYKFVEANIMYMSRQDFVSLGKFDLVWCTGVLYHNAEQLRFLRKLYNLLSPGGYLVLESATLRDSRQLRSGNFVQIHYPDTYNDTGTITHLPTRGAIKTWLNMVGFKDIYESHCYRASDRRLSQHRYACICQRPMTDSAGTYYAKSGCNPTYILGEST